MPVGEAGTAPDAASRLDGRVAVVTGAGRGLGRAYAFALAAAGAAVVVNDLDAEPATAVVAAIEAHGGRATTCVASVADADCAERIVAVARDRFGRLDAMVTNAGADRRGALLDLTPDDWDLTLRTHLGGSITCSVAAARAMRDQGDGGAIVLVTSGAFHLGSATLGPYAVAKGGIYALMRSMSVELEAVGIAVNAVMPPLVGTAQALAWVDDLGRQGVPADEVASIRAAAARPEDIAPLVVHLCSPAGRTITGHLFRPTTTSLGLFAPPREIRSVATDAPGWTPDTLGAALPALFES